MVVSHIPVSSNRVRVVEDGWQLGSLELDSNGRTIRKVELVNAWSAPVWFDDRAEAEAEVIAEGRAVRDRWQRALQRAIVAGLDPLELAGEEDAWAVESGSQPGTAYLVRGRRAQHCTCPAGAAGDNCCQHRAAVLAAIGVLSAPDPEPAAAAPCPYCNGTPVRGNNICRPCRGSGLRELVSPESLAAIEGRTAAA